MLEHQKLIRVSHVIVCKIIFPFFMSEVGTESVQSCEK